MFNRLVIYKQLGIISDLTLINGRRMEFASLRTKGMKSNQLLLDYYLHVKCHFKLLDIEKSIKLNKIVLLNYISRATIRCAKSKSKTEIYFVRLALFNKTRPLTYDLLARFERTRPPKSPLSGRFYYKLAVLLTTR